MRHTDRHPAEPFYIAVDIGGSHTAIQIVGENAAQPWMTRTLPSVRTAGGTPDLQRLVRLLHDALTASKMPASQIDTCAIGAASLPRVGQDHAPLLAWARSTGLRRLAVTGDATISYLGALGDRTGAVLACGTGVVGIGQSATGVWRRVDGWGHLLGDAGGAAWIGARGLRAALRTSDGRPHGSARLLDALYAQYGSGPDLITLLYRDPNPARITARFAPAVIDAATAGDPVAQRIQTSAINHLADTATAALSNDTRQLSYLGGLFTARPSVAKALGQAVHERRADVVIIPPRGDALDGAMTLAQQVSRSPAPPRLPELTTYGKDTDYTPAAADCRWQFSEGPSDA